MTTDLDIRVAAGVARAMALMPSATYVQYSAEVYNPATRETVEGAATNTTLKIVPPYLNTGTGFNLAKIIKATTFFAPESLLTGVSGDALATPPGVGDEIVYGSIRYKVMGIEPIRSGDLVAFYTLKIDEIKGP